MYVYMGRDKKENEEGGGKGSVKVTLKKKKGRGGEHSKGYSG